MGDLFAPRTAALIRLSSCPFDYISSSASLAPSFPSFPSSYSNLPGDHQASVLSVTHSQDVLLELWPGFPKAVTSFKAAYKLVLNYLSNTCWYGCERFPLTEEQLVAEKEKKSGHFRLTRNHFLKTPLLLVTLWRTCQFSSLPGCDSNCKWHMSCHWHCSQWDKNV